MNENAFRERYRAYYNTLIGKHEADQMLKVFQNETDLNKYSNLFHEDEKYWIINITKHHMQENPYWWFEESAHLLHIYSSFYTLYMHKEKDFVVLKSCILLPQNSRNYINNCSTFFIQQLKQKGFTKYEFTKEVKNALTKTFQNYKLNNIKIFVPVNKNEDDVIGLITMIDKFNEYVPTVPQQDWDNFTTISEKISFGG